MWISQREHTTKWELRSAERDRLQKAEEGVGRIQEPGQVGSLAQRRREMSLSSRWWEVILKAGLGRINDLTK